MRARSFLFVSLGILALAIACDLGATLARAQAGSGVECVGAELATGSAIINHELWVADLTTPGARKVEGGPIPSASPAIACGYSSAVLENGEVWANRSGAWEYVGTLPLSGPVPTAQTSWGQVKVRYR